MKGIGKGRGFLCFIVILGAVSGSILGDIFGNDISQLSFLKYYYTFGTPTPVVINLKVLVLSFGLNFNINIMTIIGMIMAIIIYRRY